MNVIPIYKRGGYEDYFVEYESLPKPRLETSSKRSKDSDDSEKGRLTEKDLFTMLKDMNGLPNEMQEIVSDLMGVFSTNSLTNMSPSSLANTYLKALYKIKVATLNKERYDAVIKSAEDKGSMYEPAIAPNGKLVVLKKDGSITTVDLSTYKANSEEYSPLTVSQLADLRKFDPSLSHDQDTINIINNSMGYKEFQALIGSATQSLSSSSNTREGMFSTEAAKGLQLLQTLSLNDLVLALGSVTAEGLYKYLIIDKNQYNQINSAIKYLVQALPQSAKTWAAIKTGIDDPDVASAKLIQDYLLGLTGAEHKFTIDYKGEGGSSDGSEDGKGGSSNNPVEGFWRQVLSGKGGDDFTFTILNKKYKMTTDGKFYGTTPGLEKNKSLSAYISDSGLGYLRTQGNTITFGDVKLSSESFKDVMVNANGGAAVVTLPIKPDGTVDLKASERYEAFKLDVKELQGLDVKSKEYRDKVQKLAEDHDVDHLINENGQLNKKRFGHFLVLEGFTSEKAKAINKESKEVSIENIESDFILSAGEDDATYEMMLEALSTKGEDGKVDKYDLVNSWWRVDDDLYKGNIYIPINTNPLNAANADKTDIKESKARQYEKAQLLLSTSSEVL